MKLTKKQEKELTDGCHQQDFTRFLPMSGEMDISDSQVETYVKIKNRVLGYMKSNLCDLGIKRDMRHFTKNHPVNILMNADASYVAEAATDILGDEEQVVAAVEQYLEWFEPIIEYAIEAFCDAEGKTQEELTEEDVQCILGRVVEVGNEELVFLLLMGQQMPEINAVTRKAPAHEDLGQKRNEDAINFYNKWNHNKTKIGIMLSLDDEPLREKLYEDELIERMKVDEFYRTLSNVDAEILRLREAGLTYKLIAEELGYKNHSAVIKRVRKLQEKWIKFN